jgi:amino acid permease
MSNRRSYGSIEHKQYVGKNHPVHYESFSRSILECPDNLHPPFDAISRQGTILVGIFNIVSTSLDGSVLTLPFLMKKSGIFIGTILIVVIGVCSAHSLDYLALCTRKIQGVSYTEIVYRLLGRSYRNVFSTLLFIILMFILVGFFILMKDIANNISSHYFHISFNQYFLMFLLFTPVFPFMTMENLHALRYTCYIGSFSMIFLLFLMMYIIYTATTTTYNLPPSSTKHIPQDSAEWIQYLYSAIPLFPRQWIDILESIPIIFMLYLNHFNFLGVLAQLVYPTYACTQILVCSSITLLTILFLCLGIVGNILAAVFTVLLHPTLERGEIIMEDNILNIFPLREDDRHDHTIMKQYEIVWLARLITLISLLCTVPIMVIPARSLLYEVEETLIHYVVAWITPEDVIMQDEECSEQDHKTIEMPLRTAMEDWSEADEEEGGEFTYSDEEEEEVENDELEMEAIQQICDSEAIAESKYNYLHSSYQRSDRTRSTLLTPQHEEGAKLCYAPKIHSSITFPHPMSTAIPSSATTSASIATLLQPQTTLAGLKNESLSMPLKARSGAGHTPPAAVVLRSRAASPSPTCVASQPLTTHRSPWHRSASRHATYPLTQDHYRRQNYYELFIEGSEVGFDGIEANWRLWNIMPLDTVPSSFTITVLETPPSSPLHQSNSTKRLLKRRKHYLQRWEKQESDYLIKERGDEESEGERKVTKDGKGTAMRGIAFEETEGEREEMKDFLAEQHTKRSLRLTPVQKSFDGRRNSQKERFISEEDLEWLEEKDYPESKELSLHNEAYLHKEYGLPSSTENESTPLLPLSHRFNPKTFEEVEEEAVEEVDELNKLSTKTAIQFIPKPFFRSEKHVIKNLLTFVIISVVILSAGMIPQGVAIVWETSGSMIGPWIAWIIPACCYLRLRTYLHAYHNARDIRIPIAYMLIITGTLVSLLCSIRTIAHIFFQV